MDKRYQIFVSSTYSDLHKEREKVIHELTRIGFVAVGMEQFPATDEEQLEYIRPIIDESDYYVVIIRSKYGSVGSDGISFTEKECDYALETKKPVLAFLFKNPGQLRVEETDNDPEKARMLKAFIKKLEEKRIVKYWEDGDQLVNDIKDSIHDIVRRRPGIGWIRGDQALDPTVYKELEEVRRQNKELQEKLDKLGNGEIVFPSHLSHGSDMFEFEYTVLERSKDQYITKTGPHCYKISWDSLLNNLAELIDYEQDESKIETHIDNMIRMENNIGDNLSVNVEASYVELARHQFEALGLISVFMTGTKWRRMTWSFTDKGRRYFAQSKALKRSTGS